MCLQPPVNKYVAFEKQETQVGKFCLGARLVNALENPLKQSYFLEMLWLRIEPILFDESTIT